MILDIDINKSIERKRIIPKSLITFYSDYFIYGLSALAFLVMIIITLKDNGYIFDYPITIGIIVYAIVYSLLYYQISEMDKLTEISNDGGFLNHDLFIAKALGYKWQIVKNNRDIIIFQTNAEYSNERQVTILFDQGFIYFNVMSFGRGSIKSPIYFKSDKEIHKMIERWIKEKTPHNTGYTSGGFQSNL